MQTAFGCADVGFEENWKMDSEYVYMAINCWPSFGISFVEVVAP